MRNGIARGRRSQAKVGYIVEMEADIGIVECVREIGYIERMQGSCMEVKVSKRSKFRHITV